MEQLYKATIYGVDGQVIYVLFDNGTYGVITGLDPSKVAYGEVYQTTYSGEIYNNYPVVKYYEENLAKESYPPTYQETYGKTSQQVYQETYGAIPQQAYQETYEETPQQVYQETYEEAPQQVYQETYEETPPQQVYQETYGAIPQQVYQGTYEEAPQQVYQEIYEEAPQQVYQETYEEASPQQAYQETYEEAPQQAYQETYQAEQQPSYQDSVFASEPAAELESSQKEDGLPNGWNNWYGMDLGHRSAVNSLTSLRDFYYNYLNTVEKYRREMNAKISESTDARDKRIAEYEQDYEAMVEKSLTMKTSIAESVDDAKNKYVSIKNDMLEYGSTVRSFSNQASGAASIYLGEAINKINEAISLQEKRHHDTYVAIDQDLQEEKRRKDQKIADAMVEYDKSNSDYRNEFQLRVRNLQAKYAQKISQGMSEKCIHSYINLVNSSRVNAAHYVSTKTLPENIYFGNLCIDLDRSTDSDHADISHIIEKEAHEVSSHVGQNLKISMPYCQKYSEGLSLMVKYQTAENDRVKKIIFPTLLKLFMSFPAGKLEATMIDPLESGASFPDVVKLAGATSERVIDSKIWCTSNEIESAITTFGSKLQNLIQSYGDDKESMLKREELKVLAITDFPHGFSQSALETLQAIVRSSAMNGVVILIWTDDKELEQLRKKMLHW